MPGKEDTEMEPLMSADGKDPIEPKFEEYYKQHAGDEQSGSEVVEIQEPAPSHAAHGPSFESLNFDTVMSMLWAIKGATSNRHVRVKGKAFKNGRPFMKPVETQRVVNRIIVICLVGILAGCTAWILKNGSGYLTEYRAELVSTVYSSNGFLGLMCFIIWNCAMSALSCIIVLEYAPGAKGSGIPEVKSYLNGVDVPNTLSVKTLCATIIGTILSTSSGLCVGPEGPLVHIVSCIASFFTSGRKVINAGWVEISMDLPFMKEFNDDLNRRNFITMAAGTGFAAAFGSPIGGVLFSLEEMATHFPLKLLWRCLLSNTLACFTLLFITSGGLFSTVSQYGALSFGSFDNMQLYAWELPFFVLLGVLCGCVGAFYNNNAKLFFKIRPKQKPWALGEVMFITVATSLITYLLVQYGGHCMPKWNTNYGSMQDALKVEKMGGGMYGQAWYHWASDRSFDSHHCPEDHFNDMAYLWLAPREDALKAAIESTHAFSLQTLALMCVCFFSLQSWTFGTSITAGIFMPTMMVGSCLGGACGMVVKALVPGSWEYEPQTMGVGIWALMGAAGMLGGVQRTAVSLCVIILEGTGQIQFLLPVIIVVMTATWVGNCINDGVYHVMIHNKHIPLLEPECKGHHIVKASNIMSSPAVCLESIPKVSDIVDVLSNTNHNGFPVVEGGFDREGQHPTYRGLVSRAQLLGLLKAKHFLDGDELADSSRREGHQLDDITTTSTSAVNFTLADITGNISEKELSMIMKLDDTVNIQPVTVHEHTPFQRVHKVFVQNGLRHLAVLDDYGNTVGVITRQDIYDQVNGVDVPDDHEFGGFVPEDCDDLFALLDTDGDGIIDTEEWAKAEEVLGGGERKEQRWVD